MISSLITASLGDLKNDVSTVCGLVFLVVLVIYFFVKIKPALDSQRRINRQVSRRIERDKANQIYWSKNQVQRLMNQQQIKKIHADSMYKNTQGFKPFSKQDKGYQAYLKRKSSSLLNKQINRHNLYKKQARRNHA